VFEHSPPKISENASTIGNIEFQKLLEMVGENMTAEINLLDLIRMKNADFFFFAVKKVEVAEVHIKKYNRPKLEKCLDILREVDEILNPQNVSENTSDDTVLVNFEKRQNMIVNAKIKRECALKNIKPSYKIVSEIQLEIVKKSDIEFAFFDRKDGKFNLFFCPKMRTKSTPHSKGVTKKRQ
jgi:hypothetical protein